MYQTTGILHYGERSYLALHVDPEIGKLYRSFIPKKIDFNRPLHLLHVTVTRTGAETIVNREHWKKYEGQEVLVYYSPHIMIGTSYIWLPVYSIRLEEIRLELGLLRFFDRFKQFHVTIANMKGTLSEGSCIDYGELSSGP